jgi:DNA/RNA-binding domain of Phe-tRNA-synthetase-like protein
VVADAYVDGAVRQQRPDYRALLIVAEGVRGGPSDEASDAALQRAEHIARERLAGRPPEDLPEIVAWRDALRGFGVKPRQARSSVEALLRRVDPGLPRINVLTDLYNAVSIGHLLPVGGEDLGHYVGPPRLVCANGDEPFDTVADGVPITDVPEPGEVVWRDDVGVTCRRWNWRQCVRTRLTEHTVDALFILDALDPLDDDALAQAGDEFAELLVAHSPGAAITTRLLGPA